jgi:hypothetical protein
MIAYGFAGAILGLFMVAVFTPVAHTEPKMPMPGEPKIFHTKTGCVRISSEEVSCSSKAISLNLINDRKDVEKS